MRRVFALHKSPRIIICSNDIEWCKDQWMFKDNDTILFSHSKTELEDLNIMSKCVYGGICSNSTFSWWGSFLNTQSKHKKYIPAKWLANELWSTQLAEPSTMIEEVSIDGWFLPITYINLKHRNDRRSLVQGELESKLQIQKEYITRFDAIYVKERGHLGCCASHVHALQNFLSTKCPLGMILEDDAQMISDLSHLKQFFADLQGPNFDGLLLGGGLISKYDDGSLASVNGKMLALRLKESQQTVGYIITRNEAKRLVQLWTNGMLSLCDTKVPQHHFCIDQNWKQLHRTDYWYVLEPLLCMQRRSFSDIEKTVK